MAEDQAWQKWFEEVWADREERLYAQFFGAMEKGMYPLTGTVFKRYGKSEPDPRFLMNGVLTSRPNEKRATWLYVTSGLSNAWGSTPETVDANEYSGLGMELVLETPEKADWAVGVLHWLMVVQLMVATGDMKGELIEVNDWLPVGGAIDGRNSALTALVVGEPTGYPKRFDLGSGKVDLLACVGISEREREFAKAQGGEGLVKVLGHHGVWPVTDAGRASVI